MLPRGHSSVLCVLCMLSWTARQSLKIYPPPPSARKDCKNPVAAVNEAQMRELDPSGERRALFDYRRNPRSVKPGDILRVTFRNGDPFSGVCLSIRLRGIDTTFLLRNHLTRVPVEMWIKALSPNVQSVEVVQRAEGRKRRARLYYMRWAFPFFFPLFSLPTWSLQQLTASLRLLTGPLQEPQA